eukprot:TRINITY_DN16832_c0_g1_i1.p1 TRINITY_DN16832_c0_g1~~TRINITY_DN16832_c0_g1_i1.p1  ORF type:complete len:750 (+),score=158.62 TRINITY_DN16832_c0_g1_i1:300-2252(+)
MVGKWHNLTGGIIIGGTDMGDESGIVNLNIIVATPGRLIHHLDSTHGFDPSNCQMLVLDEADRLLDMGFQQTIDNILQILPPTMQTLLFSATQTKSLDSLARLSVRDPHYAQVHQNSRLVTPKKLCQNYTVVEADDKMSVLYSFMKRFTREKTIIFFATCNQVKFAYLALTRLMKKDGICAMCLTGKMRPSQRNEVFDAYNQKSAAVLLCTDIAARGLDFRAIKWVVQMDCPTDIDTYIHRVGRTARAGANGASLLVLTEAEQLFLKRLADKKIRLREIDINPKHLHSVTPLLVALLVQDSELKANAQKAVISYLRSIYFESDKEVFDVNKINATELSSSYGLAVPPTLKFISQGTKTLKNTSWDVRNMQEAKESSGKTKKERKHASHHATTVQEHRDKLVDKESDEESSDLDDIFVKRSVEATDMPDDVVEDERETGADMPALKMSRRNLKKLRSNPLSLPENARGTKVVYGSDSDDEGVELTAFERAVRDLRSKGADSLKEDWQGDYTKNDKAQEEFRKEQAQKVAKADPNDLRAQKERIKEKHRLIKDIKKEMRGEGRRKTNDEQSVAVLDTNNDDDDSHSDPSEVSFEPDLRSVDSLGNVDSSDYSDEPMQPVVTKKKRKKKKVVATKKRSKIDAQEDAILKMIGS